MIILSIAALTIAFLDQTCKYFVRRCIPNNIFYNTCLEFLTFGHVENYGAAFGSFSGMRWCLVAVSLFATIAIIWATISKKIDNRRFLISFSLILGGTLSNLFDRMVLLLIILKFLFSIRFAIWEITAYQSVCLRY